MNRLLLTAFVGVLLLFSSCGYRVANQGMLPSRYHTISVCYVEGDREGHLTSELVHELTSCGGFTYCREGGDLLLEVEIVEQEDDVIGYRFDRDENEEVTKRVIATEGRLKAVAEIRGIDCSSGCTIIGPVRVTSAVDYDHDYYSRGVRMPVFSLGQLDDLDVARDVAQKALDTELAREIVSYLVTIW